MSLGVELDEFGELGDKFLGILKNARRHLTSLKNDEAISFEVARQKLPKEPGIYVLYENDLPVYVGRARDLRKRIGQHINGTATGSTFAFLLARNETGRKPTYNSIGSRGDLLTNDEVFKAAFIRSIERIKQMFVKSCVIQDDNLQYLFEFLCALEFETEHNKFRTT